MNTIINSGRTCVLGLAAVIALACMLLPAAAYAQDDSARAYKRTEMLKQRLELTDEQTEQVYSILKAAHDERKCESAETYKSAKECLEQHRAQTSEAVQAVLTDEQKEEFANMKQRWEGFHKKGLRRGCPRDGMGRGK